MLGEQSHGDGATFLAKTRLVKFLHQEMGFDVLAFESGFYDCRKSWLQLNDGMAASTAFNRGVFDIWSLSEQVQPLIDYWGTTVHSARPLELSGFDCQFTGRNSYDHFVSDLVNHITATGSDIMTDVGWPPFRSILINLVRNRYYTFPPPNETQQTAFFAMLDRLDSELASVVDDPDPNETAFWRQLLPNIDAQARRMWSLKATDREHPLDDPDSLANLRDLQMGENLLWLLENRFPGRKVIVWAATFHNARNISSVEFVGWPGVYDGVETMGQVVGDALGDQVYSIGFTACEGEAGSIYNPPTQLQPIVEGSLEDFLYQTEMPYLFVDYRGLPSDGQWLAEPLVSWPLGYSPARADWTQVMDGLLCTRVMTPSVHKSGN
ncbi:MAG: erythromycin esterase family protein [Candidatus Latescibacterota bacterium]|nr:MAG: erythromycin esterase family protein [Candidatus Latescibacterota bacterium]